MDPKLAQTIETSNGLVVHHHEHRHEARPLIVTEKTCEAVAGLSVKAYRRVLRLAGIPTIKTVDGAGALLADLEKAIREQGAPLPVTEPRKHLGTPAEEEDELLLRRAGVKLSRVG